MLSARAALGLYALVLPLTLLGGATFGGGLFGITLVEVACIAVPVVALARAAGPRPGATLGLAPVGLGTLAGAALAGSSAWLVLVQLVLPLQERVAPMPPELARQMEGATAPGAPLALAFLALAVTPAICEELLCRGVLLLALRPRLGRAAALVVSSALFAVLHLSPYRFVPTFLLGIMFGAVALRSGSIVPAMLAHACNNAAVVLVGHPAGERLRAGLEAHAIEATVGAVCILTIGLGLVRRKQ